jgi:hypothetical protein
MLKAALFLTSQKVGLYILMFSFGFHFKLYPDPKTKPECIPVPLLVHFRQKNAVSVIVLLHNSLEKIFQQNKPFLSNTPYRLKNYSCVFSDFKKLFLFVLYMGVIKTQNFTLISNPLKYLRKKFRTIRSYLSTTHHFIYPAWINASPNFLRWPPLLLPFSGLHTATP